jgi:hypothetical protein
MDDFWRTFDHDGKITAERADTLTLRLFISTPMYTLWLLPCAGQESAKYLGTAITVAHWPGSAVTMCRAGINCSS